MILRFGFHLHLTSTNQWTIIVNVAFRKYVHYTRTRTKQFKHYFNIKYEKNVPRNQLRHAVHENFIFFIQAPRSRNERSSNSNYESENLEIVCTKWRIPRKWEINFVWFWFFLCFFDVFLLFVENNSFFCLNFFFEIYLHLQVFPCWNHIFQWKFCINSMRIFNVIGIYANILYIQLKNSQKERKAGERTWKKKQINSKEICRKLANAKYEIG